MRLLLATAALVAVSVVAIADAVVRENGPIFFFGSRAPDLYSEIYSVAADGTGRINLTRNPASDGGPAVSPDGKRVAFVSHRDGYAAVYLMNADGSGQEQLVSRLPPYLASPYRIGALVWSPDGRQLAFTATQPPVGSFFESSFVYLVELAGRRVRLLWGVGCGGGAAFSPDGRFVAYGVVYCRSGGGEVRVARAADGRAELTVSGTFVGWAPRGNRLLFLRRTRDPKIQHLATVDRSGRKLWVLRGVPATDAAWSPNGRLIAFVRRTGRRPGVYVVRPGGQRPRRLVTLANGLSVAWSPNGAWLALAAARASSEGGLTIYIVRPSGRGLRRVAGARTLPVWSRDSRHLAFVGLGDAVRVVSPPSTSAVRVSDPATDLVGGGMDWIGGRLLFTAGGRRTTQLLAVEPDGSGVRRVSPGATPVGAISPDGSRVAFVRDADIWTARLDGNDERQVTSGAALDGRPAWSPDGQRIAFGRAAGGASDIFVVEAAGGPPRQLTHQDVPTGGAGAPTWSPDGDWIAFVSSGGLFAVHPDGSGRHRISTVTPRAHEGSVWSPDGTRIALGGCAIAVVNADGSGYRELTGSGVREGQPSWSPDGTKIVFVRSAVPCPGDFAGDSDLWTINPDGSGETRLTDGPWPDRVPSWQPVRP